MEFKKWWMVLIVLGVCFLFTDEASAQWGAGRAARRALRDPAAPLFPGRAPGLPGAEGTPESGLPGDAAQPPRLFRRNPWNPALDQEGTPEGTPQNAQTNDAPNPPGLFGFRQRLADERKRQAELLENRAESPTPGSPFPALREPSAFLPTPNELRRRAGVPLPSEALPTERPTVGSLFQARPVDSTQLQENIAPTDTKPLRDMNAEEISDLFNE